MREDRQLFLQTTTRPINKFSGGAGPAADSAGLVVLSATPEPLFIRGNSGGSVTLFLVGPELGPSRFSLFKEQSGRSNLQH